MQGETLPNAKEVGLRLGQASEFSLGQLFSYSRLAVVYGERGHTAGCYGAHAATQQLPRRLPLPQSHCRRSSAAA